VRIGPPADPSHLTYCLNVHPGETLADVRRAIGDCAVAVRQRLGCREPFGLGLRLSRRAVDELADPRALGALREASPATGAMRTRSTPFRTVHFTAWL
jgi:hypothetical protein